MSDTPSDAGLQGERTTMAWVRSALAFLGAGLWVAKQTGPAGLALAVVVGSVLAAAVTATMAERRYRARAAGRAAASWPAIALTAAATVGLAVVALLLVVG